MPAFHEDDLDLPEAPCDPSLVDELAKAFAKAIRAHQLYMANNPMHARALDAVRTAFAAVWKETEPLTFQITEAEIRWCERTVLEEADRNSESIPWLFFKDGIRELEFRPGFEESELLILLTLMQRARVASAEDDDLLTLLWEHDFAYLQYKYIELGALNGAPLELIKGEPVERIEAPSKVEGEAQLLASTSLARMDDYDSTLYFLDDNEIEYLRDEVRRDFATDLRPLVIASLLDTFEQETDPTVREEICNILDNQFLLLVSLGQFHTAAYLLREARDCAARAVEATDAQKERLTGLGNRLSEKAVLEQLLETLEGSRLRPPQTDLHELLGLLKPEALETLLAWIARSRNADLRPLLETATMRLAQTNIAELVRLIESTDDNVVFEAIRRAGAMKTSAAVAALAGTIQHGTPDMRLAGVAALADIGSAGAMQVLERALRDDDRDIRIATVKVLGSRNHHASARAIEAQIKTREFREAPLAEKIAFFDAYGTLAGDAGVALLGDILNARKLLGPREEGELRACAAMALGKIGTEDALRALQKALADRDVMVRNAVSRAVRG
jgi:HEAT repeat protein